MAAVRAVVFGAWADEVSVLEDNRRTPSDTACMLENREFMMPMFPDLFQSDRIALAGGDPGMLRRRLAGVVPKPAGASQTW